MCKAYAYSGSRNHVMACWSHLALVQEEPAKGFRVFDSAKSFNLRTVVGTEVDEQIESTLLLKNIGV